MQYILSTVSSDRQKTGSNSVLESLNLATNSLEIYYPDHDAPVGEG